MLFVDSIPLLSLFIQKSLRAEEKRESASDKNVSSGNTRRGKGGRGERFWTIFRLSRPRQEGEGQRSIRISS